LEEREHERQVQEVLRARHAHRIDDARHTHRPRALREPIVAPEFVAETRLGPPADVVEDADHADDDVITTHFS
jgi:hypothetical protein